MTSLCLQCNLDERHRSNNDFFLQFAGRYIKISLQLITNVTCRLIGILVCNGVTPATPTWFPLSPPHTHLVTLFAHSLQYPLDQAQHRVALLPLRAEEANLRRGLRKEEGSPAANRKIKAKIGVWETIVLEDKFEGLWMQTEVFFSLSLSGDQTNMDEQPKANFC